MWVKYIGKHALRIKCLCVCMRPRVCVCVHVHTCVVAYYAAAVKKASQSPSPPNLFPLQSTGKLVALLTSQCPTLECKAACVEREVATEVFQALCKTKMGGRNGTRSDIQTSSRFPKNSLTPSGSRESSPAKGRCLGSALRMLSLGPRSREGGSRCSKSVMDAL